MEKLSISEFKRMCDGINAREFQFSTSNQEDSDYYFECYALYDNIIISLVPNVIIFSSKNGRLVLRGVRHIIHRPAEYIGHIFDIICDVGNSIEACRMVVN